MDNYRSKGPNLMGLYFQPDSAVCKITSRLREGYLAGPSVVPKIDQRILDIAKREAESMGIRIDKITYPFANDLANHVLGANSIKRILLVVEGFLYGKKESTETAIGIDLTSNSHELFRHSPKEGTIDLRVTDEETRKFLDEHGHALKDRYDFLKRCSSRFFYVDEVDLLPFMDGDRIDMTQLLPFMINTTNVAGTQVETPAKEQYLEKGPRFVSYRFKGSLARKLRWRITQETLGEDDKIADWVAHRVVVETKEEATRLKEILEGKVEDFLDEKSGLVVIGRSRLEYAGRSKDYYANPKPIKVDGELKDGYQGHHVISMVGTRRQRYRAVREIQIVHREQYFNQEIDPENPASHNGHERKKREATDAYTTSLEKRLEEIFGRGTAIMQI